ncbi:MAG: KH domain-containing protein [Victivallaceae bacterium]|nr:KH domain-containing protein [Victivallaceae bacterium]
MLKAFLKKIFGGSTEGTTACGCSAAKAGNGSLRDLEGFVDYVVRSLVDFPDEVKIVTEENDEGCAIKISCRKEDIGKIVGKRGKTIMAIRSLVSGAAGRQRKRVSVEVLD